MERRGKTMMIFFTICIVLLAGRLYYIQITCGPVLSAAADEQQQVPVIYPYSRGIIYDRNMEKLTDTSCEYYYLIDRENCTPEFKALIQLIGGTKAGKKGESYEVYRVEQFQPTINSLLQQEHQAYGFCVSSRYEDEQVAAHLIGYLHEADGTGASGLEKMYENQLGSDGPTTYLLGNGIGDVVDGLGISTRNINVELPAGLVTTIDKVLQSAVESLLSEKHVSGTVVIADAKNGQILTMASNPTYNPNAIEDYLSNDGSELVNKAMQCQYPPGPILDVLRETAALGKVSLVEAATSLGFGQCVWENFPNEAEGYLPEGAGDYEKAMEITPIQVCQMMVTLANLGGKIPLSIVTSNAQGGIVPCLDLTGQEEETEKGETKTSGISAEEFLQKLNETPVSGDGWATGICRIGVDDAAQNAYVITVYIEDKKSKALPIFRDIRGILENS